MTDGTRCNDFGGRPGCLGDVDERYTMRFDDIGKPPICWCAHCGPDAHAMDRALTRALTRGPKFIEELTTAIDVEVAKQKMSSS